MDRISALRNVEDALAAYEEGEATLGATEERVLAILRTYATEFADGDLAAWRATGDARADGVVVVAAGPKDARDRVRGLLDAAPGDLAFEVERLD